MSKAYNHWAMVIHHSRRAGIDPVRLLVNRNDYNGYMTEFYGDTQLVNLRYYDVMLVPSHDIPPGQCAPVAENMR